MRWLAISGALALSGCNLVFGLEEATDRPGGSTAGGDAPGGEGPGGDGGGANGPSGGGGSDPSGGSGTGGSGGSPCPPEVPAGRGTELMVNGSFEDGTLGWVDSSLFGFSIIDEGSDCGCRAAHVQLGSGYGELRGALPAPASAGMVHARARVSAPDAVEVGLLLRVDSNTVEPAPGFPADAADGTVDGWRTLEWDWLMPAGTSAFFVVNVDGAASPPDSDMIVDCVSLVRED